MIALRKISMAAASRFMDFAAGSKEAQSVAPLQMKGAVGAHNILADRKAVYLGDEVGMGKTYVALGTLALIRHFHPSLRVLYIVPKENLQSKWIKEIHNFASQKWNFTDSRVKAIHGRAVAEPAKCESLLDLVEKAALDANRDFILRLSSFSFGLRNEVQTWRQKARELRRAFPGLAEAALEVDGRSADKEGFKDQFACAVNAVLPHFDLLVLDEGHNLKHGCRDGQGSTRNRLLALVLGTKAPPPGLPPTERRIDRAILLSATPVDRDYKDLWNQLDLLGLAEGLEELADDQLDDARRKDIARKFMIRRVGSIQIAGRPHTRNMYRREWRGGGVSQHDDPLKVPDGRQRLVVALMQKKVADLMAAQGRQSGKRFSRSFQIGMLASFESFSRTAKVQGVDANFDQAEQTEDQTERQGIDTRTINDIASGYRQLFGESLPHPKMDAVVQEAWQRLREARKTLIFVRRVHSVPEIVEKLTKLYDQWLYDRIRGDIKAVSDSAEMLEQAWEKYEPERIQFYEDAGAAFAANASRTQDDEPDEQDGPAPPSASRAIRDVARPESFFSWFFRGDGPSGILSGAKFVQNRLTNESASLSTFFEDNWVLWLLGWPQRVLDRLAEVTGRTPETVRRSLQDRVSQIYSDKKAIKLRLYRAYQRAALELLVEAKYQGAEAALAALDFLPSRPDGGTRTREIQTDPEAFLGTRTFFTELAARPELCGLLWPAQADSGSVEAVRRRERMRLMLSSAIRLGHPIVDLWLSYVKLTGSLAATRQESAEADADQEADTDISIRLAKAFLDELDRQRLGQGQGCDGCFSWRELLEIGQNFDLISNVNFHDLAGKNLGELARSLGDKLGQQQPVIGMHGGVTAIDAVDESILRALCALHKTRVLGQDDPVRRETPAPRYRAVQRALSARTPASCPGPADHRARDADADRGRGSLPRAPGRSAQDVLPPSCLTERSLTFFTWPRRDRCACIRAKHVNELRQVLEWLRYGRWEMPFYMAAGMHSWWPDTPWWGDIVANDGSDEVRILGFAYVRLDAAPPYDPMNPARGISSATVTGGWFDVGSGFVLTMDQGSAARRSPAAGSTSPPTWTVRGRPTPTCPPRSACTAAPSRCRSRWMTARAGITGAMPAPGAPLAAWATASPSAASACPIATSSGPSSTASTWTPPASPPSKPWWTAPPMSPSPAAWTPAPRP